MDQTGSGGDYNQTPSTNQTTSKQESVPSTAKPAGGSGFDDFEDDIPF
jgi:hypothetical protein